MKEGDKPQIRVLAGGRTLYNLDLGVPELRGKPDPKIQILAAQEPIFATNLTIRLYR